MLKTRWVPGLGPENSPLVFVGEAPGEEEDRLGQPFVGRAGQWLDRGLRDSQILRQFQYITNVFKQRPPKNQIEHFFTEAKCNFLTEEGMLHVEFLRTELEQHSAKLIVALGDTALHALTGKRGIHRWRGSLLPCTLVEGKFVYPTFHPSYVMRMNQESNSKQESKRGENVYPIFVRDLQRSVEAASNPANLIPKRDFIICRTVDDAERQLEAIPPNSLVALDIENLRDPVIITRIGFSYDPAWGFTIPLIPGSDSASTGSGLMFGFSPSSFPQLLHSISRTCARPDLTFIIHNMMHDAAILGFYWKIAFANLHDSMILAHATHPHLPKGLQFLTSTYTWEPYYKQDGKVHNVRVGGEALSIYNIKDCYATREIFPLLIQEAKEHGTYGGYERSLSYTPSLLAMSIRGVACDKERKDRLLQEFESRATECSVQISQIMGKDYHISTAFTKDLQNLLYVDLACSPQYKEGKLTTEDDAVLRLRREAELAQDTRRKTVLDNIRLRKKLLKLSSTYLEMELGPDGRYHTTYDATGTTTWRLSSYESTIGGGANLQNIPKHPDPVSGTHFGGEIRKTFVADPGFVLVSSDLKQAEAMMVAWLSGERREISVFERGEDIHWINAQDIFGLSGIVYDSSNPALKVKRNLAKTIKHAGNYGTGPLKMQKVLLKNGFYFEQSECKMFLFNIRNSRPMVELWKKAVENQLLTNRTLVTPLGRKRVFYGRMGADLFRAGYAFIPQSTVGELVCMAIRDIYQKIEVDLGLCQILLNVHDEVVVQCLPENVNKVALLIKGCMEREISVNSMPLKIPCDFKTGINWGEMKEFDPR